MLYWRHRRTQTHYTYPWPTTDGERAQRDPALEVKLLKPDDQRKFGTLRVPSVKAGLGGATRKVQVPFNLWAPIEQMNNGILQALLPERAKSIRSCAHVPCRSQFSEIIFGFHWSDVRALCARLAMASCPAAAATIHTTTWRRAPQLFANTFDNTRT